MINLVVVSLRGAPVGRPISAQFGPNGGTIGRAPANTLVLDDPDRTVSRVHAQVECRGGQFFILDRGSNPLQHNGQALGAGRETVLGPGDRLMVGGFELIVQNAAAGTSAQASLAASADVAVPAPPDDDPFADLLGGIGKPTSSPAAPSPSRKPSTPPVSAASDSLLIPDPFGLDAGKGAGGAPIDPFADLLGPSSSVAPAGAFDDFADLGLHGAPPVGGIDNLFGGTASGGAFGGDPFENTPLGSPLLQPNTSADADPFVALQATPKSAPAPRSDHVPIGQYGYTPPKGIVPAGGTGGGLLNDLGGTPDVPAPRTDDDPFADLMPGQPPVPQSPAPMAAPPAPVVRAPIAPAPTPTPQPVPRIASDDALYEAFLNGVNSTHQMPSALTPELMERIGALLRAAAEGTLQLLHTRQQLKREVRAEVTMIAAQANNPLKFSPTVEVALAHLLGPGMRGFMPAEDAMRDAYDDLRAHEFGVMVGMRAALAHVLARFTPDELEKKIAAKSALDALFSANRKAKLWDQFVALYAGIAKEAEDDFHTLFGKAFLQAYEEQMARLKSSPPPAQG